MDHARAMIELNRHCCDAMFGYAAAATAAYGHLFEQSISAWGQAMGVAPERPAPRPSSWYRAPDYEVSGQTRSLGGPANCNIPLAVASAFDGGQGTARYMQSFAIEAWPMLAMAPWMVWVNPRYAQCWPMAAGMIAVGVPRTVAWPAAEANAAVMDAFKVAVAPATVPFRRTSGRGVGPAAKPFLALACLMAPVPAGLWLHLIEQGASAATA
ncbi:MAG: hypothetical protein NW205_11980 [Hyphomicrobiaceae bacterium]|nr:hypothetical protein [Hyphomicrobiaceae bacterium]